MTQPTHYVVLRVPTSGPKAVAGAPWRFSTRDEAEARIKDLMADHLIVHHTYLEVQELTGEIYPALDKAGIIY